MSGKPRVWTPDRLDLAHSLRRAGLPMREVARRLGCTESAAWGALWYHRYPSRRLRRTAGEAARDVRAALEVLGLASTARLSDALGAGPTAVRAGLRRLGGEVELVHTGRGKGMGKGRPRGWRLREGVG